MRKIVMVTSCKGGVGKSTVTANLGIRLALDGYKTLILDCDFGVRSLDLIMGLENSIIYDIGDVIRQTVPAEKALVSDRRSPNLKFCAAPYNYDNNITVEDFKREVEAFTERLGFDYVIIDTPGDVGNPFRLAASVATCALIVSTYQPASIRAAERTGQLLGELGVEQRRLIVNCFDQADTLKGQQPALTDIIDRTYIRLIGIIPFDKTLSEYQMTGEDIITRAPASNTSAAFENIALRLNGRNIPLFSSFNKIKRSSLMRAVLNTSK